MTIKHNQIKNGHVNTLNTVSANIILWYSSVSIFSYTPPKYTLNIYMLRALNIPEESNFKTNPIMFD